MAMLKLWRAWWAFLRESPLQLLSRLAWPSWPIMKMLEIVQLACLGVYEYKRRDWIVISILRGQLLWWSGAINTICSPAQQAPIPARGADGWWVLHVGKLPGKSAKKCEKTAVILTVSSPHCSRHLVVMSSAKHNTINNTNKVPISIFHWESRILTLLMAPYWKVTRLKRNPHTSFLICTLIGSMFSRRPE